MIYIISQGSLEPVHELPLFRNEKLCNEYLSKMEWKLAPGYYPVCWMALYND